MNRLYNNFKIYKKLDYQVPWTHKERGSLVSYYVLEYLHTKLHTIVVPQIGLEIKFAILELIPDND